MEHNPHTKQQTTCTRGQSELTEGVSIYVNIKIPLPQLHDNSLLLYHEQKSRPVHAAKPRGGAEV